jgi:sigma-B regulation protein RsbU (phosphoserine phosphatase)
MSYVNAGHNPPYIIRGGKLEKLSEQPNFVLGGKRRVDYRENRTTLQPGDVLFLYTDGVTEAVGPDGTMFGNPRLEEVLVGAGTDSGNVLRAVDDSVKGFVAGGDRYDDMTMVVFGLNRYMHEDLSFKDFVLDHGSFNEVMAHIRTELGTSGCPENVIRDIEICSSEILANIDMYAYQEKGGELGVAIRVADRKAKVVFRDKGPEYNPLLKDNPDIEKRIKDHKVGGFGLFIVRKMMDEVTYAREGDYNVLTIKRGY